MGLYLRDLAVRDADRHEFMRVDGWIWQLVYAHGLCLRMPALPAGAEGLLVPTHPTIARVVRNAGAKTPKVQTPAQRTEDGAQIGTVPVLAEALDAIEATYAGQRLLWSVWRGYFVARNPSREVVAIWKLPDGANVVTVLVVEVASVLWATNFHFAVALTLSRRGRAEMDGKIADDPKAKAMIAKVSTIAPGTIVSPREEDGACRMGPVYVPTDQFRMVAKHHPTVVWHYSGPLEPVVAREDGKVVGFVMPLLVESPGGSA